MGGAALSRAAGFTWREAVFIGTILTATSVSITAQTLLNLNKLRSKVGSTILGAAVIDDVLGLLVLSLVIALEAGAAHRFAGPASVGLTLGRIIAFSAAVSNACWLAPGIRAVRSRCTAVIAKPPPDFSSVTVAFV